MTYQHNLRTSKRVACQCGMTLLEVMITVVIFSLITGSVYQMYRMQTRTSTVHQQVSQAQQKLRGLMDFLVKHIQMSGYDRLGSANSGFVTDFENDIFDPDIDYEIENNIIAFTIDSDENGSIEANDDEQIAFRLNGTAIERYRNATSEWSVIAKGIDAANFVLLDRDRNVTTNVDEIREVEITILARTENPDATYIYTHEVYNMQGESIFSPEANDRYRRRKMMTRVKCRNLNIL